MSNYYTEAEEMTRRFDLAQHTTPHHTQHLSPTHPAPRRRARVAAGLRRVADRLEQ